MHATEYRENPLTDVPAAGASLSGVLLVRGIPSMRRSIRALLNVVHRDRSALHLTKRVRSRVGVPFGQMQKNVGCPSQRNNPTRPSFVIPHFRPGCAQPNIRQYIDKEGYS